MTGSRKLLTLALFTATQVVSALALAQSVSKQVTNLKEFVQWYDHEALYYNSQRNAVGVFFGAPNFEVNGENVGAVGYYFKYSTTPQDPKNFKTDVPSVNNGEYTCGQEDNFDITKNSGTSAIDVLKFNSADVSKATTESEKLRALLKGMRITDLDNNFVFSFCRRNANGGPGDWNPSHFQNAGGGNLTMVWSNGDKDANGNPIKADGVIIRGFPFVRTNAKVENAQTLIDWYNKMIIAPVAPLPTLGDVTAGARQLKFNPVKAGSFLMGTAKVATEISTDYSLMDTEMTQAAWAQITSLIDPNASASLLSPSQINMSAGKKFATAAGVKAIIAKDYPVNSISRVQIFTFLDGLNKLSQTADDKIQDQIRTVIPDHQKGDIYSLPTEAQWEFVMRARGTANEAYFDKADISELNKYANSNVSVPLPVGQLLPRVVDGQNFYDLEGNAYEFVFDDYSDPLIGGKDPLIRIQGSRSTVLRGGPINDASANFRLSYGDSPNQVVSFRLARNR